MYWSEIPEICIDGELQDISLKAFLLMTTLNRCERQRSEARPGPR